MTDTIIKGSGNSRTLKTVPNIKALVSDLDDLLDLFVAGFPIDLLGPNPEGCEVVGDSLGKAELLKDDTAALFGLTSDAVPDEVLAAIRPLITQAGQSGLDRAKIAAGSYTGNGASYMPVNLPFTPKAVLVMQNGLNSGSNYGNYGGFATTGSPAKNEVAVIEIVSGGFKAYGNTLTGGTSRTPCANVSGYKYNYMAIG